MPITQYMPRILHRKPPGNWTNILDGNGRRSIYRYCLLVPIFKKNVWRALLEIPYGQTLSYGEMARRIGLPNAVRAVANANGANAISIFAPCHRVIGSNRSLTGYGGGIEAKKFLLELEQERTLGVFPCFL